MKDPTGFMTMDTFEACFRDFTPMAIKLNWRGEPLLHKDLIRMIRYAKLKGVLDVALNTNALLLDKDMVKNLAHAGLDRIIISADGATKQSYESIRCGGNFEVFLKNIIHMALIHESSYSHPQVTIQVCPQDINREEIRSGFWRYTYADYANKLRIGKLHDPQGKYGFKVKVPKFCTSPWQRLTIDWQGNICLCPGDYLKAWKLGNIFYSKIYDVWHSGALNTVRDALTHEGRVITPCDKCSSYC